MGPTRIEILDTTTGKVIANYALDEAGQVRKNLLKLRRPLIEADLAAKGRLINTIEVRANDTGRWIIQQSGKVLGRYSITHKSVVAPVVTAREGSERRESRESRESRISVEIAPIGA